MRFGVSFVGWVRLEEGQYWSNIARLGDTLNKSSRMRFGVSFTGWVRLEKRQYQSDMDALRGSGRPRKSRRSLPQGLNQCFPKADEVAASIMWSTDL